MAADGAALLAAAVRAACLAKAPRRTIQAVAAAVTGVLVRPLSAAAAPAPVSSVPARPQRTAAGGDEVVPASSEDLLNALRAARSAQRRRKKERRQAAKEVARQVGLQERNAAPAGDVQGVGPQTPVQQLPAVEEEPPEKRQRADEGDAQQEVGSLPYSQRSAVFSDITMKTEASAAERRGMQRKLVEAGMSAEEAANACTPQAMPDGPASSAFAKAQDGKGKSKGQGPWEKGKSKKKR
eukprot:TRINITY_DN9415_c0_g1_i10.p2 TRINITY_DN9415_c0_g1~~TRINITY_DN9415_c0_g1_i10.p2  ORF type:complete len:239 (-),score=64.58 TRINITY_DN9415_c0_g1_i10:3122-3838(-)